MKGTVKFRYLIMQIFSQSRKTIILLTMMLSALIFSSCAIQKAENKEDVLQPIVPDAGSTVDTPIEDNEYSDDFIIEIERPNIKGTVMTLPQTT